MTCFTLKHQEQHQGATKNEKILEAKAACTYKTYKIYDKVNKVTGKTTTPTLVFLENSNKQLQSLTNIVKILLKQY